MQAVCVCVFESNLVKCFAPRLRLWTWWPGKKNSLSQAKSGLGPEKLNVLVLFPKFAVTNFEIFNFPKFEENKHLQNQQNKINIKQQFQIYQNYVKLMVNRIWDDQFEIFQPSHYTHLIIATPKLT